MLKEPSWLGAAGHCWQVCGRVVSPLPSSAASSPGLIRLAARSPGGGTPIHPTHRTSPRPTVSHSIPAAAPLHPTRSIPSPPPGSPGCRLPPAPPYLSGAWPGTAAGTGHGCPARSRAASSTKRGQRLPWLSLLAGEEPGYSQPLVWEWVWCGGVSVCECA